jgi:hypothetical protein
VASGHCSKHLGEKRLRGLSAFRVGRLSCQMSTHTRRTEMFVSRQHGSVVVSMFPEVAPEILSRRCSRGWVRPSLRSCSFWMACVVLRATIFWSASSPGPRDDASIMHRFGRTRLYMNCSYSNGLLQCSLRPQCASALGTFKLPMLHTRPLPSTVSLCTVGTTTLQ